MLQLAAVLASLVLFVVALLAIPVSLVVDIERTAWFQTRLRLRWLFGLVDVEMGRQRERGSPPGRPSNKAEQSRHVATRSRPRGRGPAIAMALVRTEGLIARVLLLLQDLAVRFSFQDIYLRVDFGLDDPADTGRLYGTLAPVMFAAEAGGCDVRCWPNFQEPSLRGSCGGRIQARPISVLGVVIRFLGSPAILRAIRAVWAARR